MLGMRATNRGIVIVSILVLTLLATFFLGALVQMNPGRLRRNVHDENRDRATMAARAGVDYVLSRFKSDTNWIGDANTRTVDMEDLVIREDNGNVLGWIRTEGGSWAGFRVRFNAQDGDGGFDSRGNPMYPINNNAISLNNLGPLLDKAVPRATPNSVADGSTEPGDPDTVMIMPGNSVALQVEGIVAPDLRPDDPAGLAEIEEATIRTVEGIYVISDIISGRDDSSVVSGGGPVTANVNGSAGTISTDLGDTEIKDGVLSLQSDSDNAATVRTKGYFDLKGNDNFDPDQDASVRTNPGHPFEKDLDDGTTFRGGIEEKDATYQKVEWDRIKDSEQSGGAVTLPGGVYIFTDGDTDSSSRSPENNVKYFDMPWSQYKAELMDTDPTTPRSSDVPPEFLGMVELDAIDVTLKRNGTGEISNEKRDVIRVTGDIDISDPDGKGFTVVPERGARQKAGSDDAGSPDDPVPTTPDQGVAQSGLEGGIIGGLNDFLLDNPAVSGGSLIILPGTHGGPISYNLTDQDIQQGQSFLMPLYNNLANPGGSFDIATTSDVTAQLETAMPYAEFVYNPPPAGTTTVTINSPGPALNYTSGGGSDPLHIPKKHPVTGADISLDGGPADETVPQDIEIVFDPAEGHDTAFIRSDKEYPSDIFLGAHLSGEGGGVISNKTVNLIGFGINIRAKTEQNMSERQERTGVAIYGKEGINVSTYDERRNSYWDVEVKGAVFTEGNLFLRMGEDPLPSGDNPPWGLLDFEGTMIALGDAPYVETDDTENPFRNPLTDGEDPDTTPYDFKENDGRVDMFARGVRLFYDPRYLAPLLEEGTINPTFSALSVVER